MSIASIGLAQKKNKAKTAFDLNAVESFSAQGRWLEFKAGQKRRVHVWHDEGIWHFRCTCGINATIFDGTVSLDKGLIRIVGGEGDLEQRGKAGKITNPNNADYLQVTPAGVAFRFQCVGKLDGLDFVVPKEAKTIRFQFHVNGESDPEYIFIGASGDHPSKATFLLPAHP